MTVRLHIDVTSCWERRGAPVGISRVVAELAQVVRALGPEHRAWRYDRTIRQLVPVSWAAFERIVAARPSPRSAWRERVRRLPLLGALAARLSRSRRSSSGPADPPTFGPDDRFVFGDWVGDGARLAVYRAMIARGTRMVFYCHDLIPILYPDLVEPATRRWFAAYLDVLLRAETRVICNSRATLADLAQAGTVPHATWVIPPGADIADGPGRAVRRIVPARRYILYVSTLEPRKNHRLLLDAYDRLLAAGRDDLPLLVFVGRRGWMVDDLLHRIGHGTGAGRHVRILDRVADDELRDLYAQAAFTVFPSRYEGWGMPVGEALALGRFCLCANRGALPEVAAGCAELLDPDDDALWAARIAYYLDHPGAVHAREAAIRARHSPRRWSDFRRDVRAALADG